MEMAILMTQILNQSDENFFNCTSILRDVLLRKNAFFWILSKLPPQSMGWCLREDSLPTLEMFALSAITCHFTCAYTGGREGVVHRGP